MISQARQAAARATRNVRNAGPPTATQRIVGAVAWLMTSRHHGKPPQGPRSRTASATTHQPATATGQALSRSRNDWPIVSTEKITASPVARATQTYQARFTSQDSRG